MAAIIALLTIPAYAQQRQMGQSPAASAPQETEAEKRQRVKDEKAYKDALARVPSREKKADPWGGVR